MTLSHVVALRPNKYHATTTPFVKIVQLVSLWGDYHGEKWTILNSEDLVEKLEYFTMTLCLFSSRAEHHLLKVAGVGLLPRVTITNVCNSSQRACIQLLTFAGHVFGAI